MALSKSENRKKWAVLAGFTIFVVHSIVLLIALNFLATSLMTTYFCGEKNAMETLSYNVNAMDAVFPEVDSIPDEERIWWFCVLVTFTIIGICTSGFQIYGTKLLINAGTSENLKASQACKLVCRHQSIQQTFLFLEVVLFMIAVYSPVFDRLIEFIGSENIIMSAIFRSICLYIVEFYRSELDAATGLEVDQKKQEVNGKDATVEISPIIQEEAEEKVAPA